MVKYLLHGWGWGMPQPQSGVMVYHTLSEEEFNIQRVGAESHIGNQAVARLLHAPFNPNHIELNVGDTALVVYTEGGKLPYNATSLPDGITFAYKCVKILDEI